MFGFGKQHQPDPVPPGNLMRDTLFGDMPWEQWASDAKNIPGHFFFQARTFRDAGQNDKAVASLQHILAEPNLEARIYLQAWHFLRQLGVQPPADRAKKVLGVVIEVGMPAGLDLLAGYADGSARYWNFSGAGVVWDAKGDAAIDAGVEKLLARGQVVAEKIGPWLEPRRPAPGRDMMRLNMLTPSGLHFGEAPLAVFSKDPLAGPLVSAGVELMRLLMAKAEPAKAKGRTA